MFKLTDSNQSLVSVYQFSQLKEKIKSLDDIDKPDKEDRSHCLDFLMLIYLKLLQPEMGIPCVPETFKKLFFAFTTIPIEDFLVEYDSVNELVKGEIVDIYSQILRAPFRHIEYDNGNPQFVWYEKFCLIYLFTLLKFLNLTQKEYKIYDRNFNIPSLETCRTMKKDEEFSKELVSIAAYEKTLFIDILYARDESIYPVFFLLYRSCSIVM